VFELSAEEQAAYWVDVALVARAIDAAFHPMKINLMTLGNWGPHLHTHVVPRYLDDPAPGNPIHYPDMLTEQPLPETTIREWAALLRPHLQWDGMNRRTDET
jgi:diadenosine tetraphosphate (Ap4A) HIT family hydrolase